MMPLPPRLTRAELVVSRLREGIDSGEWRDRLPSERKLSRALSVSRASLRLALDQLKREGWLSVKRKRTCIERIPTSPGPEPMRTRHIVFLSPLPLERLPAQALFAYGELARRLSPLDATIQLSTSGAFTHQHAERYLDDLRASLNADGWVLHRTPREVQSYFQNKALPAVIFGNAHEGIELPALQVDYPAALRHCVSRLRRIGHAPERIALVLPDTELAGNLQLENSFRRITREARKGEKWAGMILRHDDEGENLPALIDRAIRRKNRPTAFIVLRTSVATALHGLLPHRFHLTIPHHLSLACLEDAPFMKHLVPAVSRYHVDNDKIVRLIFASLSKQLSSGLSRSWRHSPLIPEFVEGGTLTTPG